MQLRKNPKAIVASMAILASSVAGVNLMPASSASAICRGVNRPVPVTDDVRGVREEVSLSGTCDRQKDYYGKYLDIKHDGAAVYVAYKKNGIWLTTSPNGSETEFMNYSFTHPRRKARMKVCNTTSGCGRSFLNFGY